ncbi:glycosyl hydrolase family 95 catalytic domain-containing protein [Kineococcus sp. SYSU DK002]|uniref:glycosyl hydrolase family 95 catalytic domain-containing protein n=1 Tax=Kineococcus sp. SYSU DK002 TaxID=3383123 RepID=UPI003D7DB604
MTRHLLSCPAPAARFADSFLLGDGRLGVTVAGGIGSERYDLNADTLWSGGPLPARRDAGAADVLPALRAAVAAGDHALADELGRRLHADGYTESYQPVGHLTWAYDPAATSGDVQEYARELDLARALSTTRYTGRHGGAGGPVALETFVDPVGSVAVTVLDRPGPGPGPAPLTFTSPHPLGVQRHEDLPGGRLTLAAGRVPAAVVPNYVPDEDPVRYADDGPDAAGTVARGTGFAVAALEQVVEGRPRVLTTVVTGFRGPRERPGADLEALLDRARERVLAVAATPTGVLRERTEQAHRVFFDRSEVELGPAAGHERTAAEAELLFDLGRYLLIASSRPGTQAANLQGIWNVDVRPGWSSNYTTNINLTMNYWAAEPTGLGELHTPLFDLALDLADAGRETARLDYGAAGAVVHHNTDLWRFTRAVAGQPLWSNWTGALPWVAAHAYDHVDFGSGDDRFVRDVALPVHRAAAAFALDLLVDDGAGRLVVSPSTSPENTFVLPGGSSAAITAGSTMDQELVTEVFAHYLDLLARSGTVDPADHDLAGRVREAAARVRPPAVVDGVLQEWDPGKVSAEPGHRHVSHLYGLFPGTRITASRTPGHRDAACRALEERLRHGGGHTGWSRSWAVALAARLGQGDRAAEHLRVLVEDLASDSLLDMHPHPHWPGGAIFQIDGNFGVTAGICEVLVQGHDDAVDLLPALPAAWPSGRFRGLRVRGGHRVDARWSGGRLVGARVLAGTGGQLAVRAPADGLEVLRGDEVVATATAAADGTTTVRWDAAAGDGHVVRVPGAVPGARPPAGDGTVAG